MGDTKREEQNEPKKPIGEQVTDFVAAGAGALAENTVQSVAKSVRKVNCVARPRRQWKRMRAGVIPLSYRAADRAARRETAWLAQLRVQLAGAAGGSAAG